MEALITNSADITKDFIPRAEAAKRLGRCSRTLHRWEEAEYGPRAIRLGRDVFYTSKEVDRFRRREMTHA
jgi:hypothetical protein